MTALTPPLTSRAPIEHGRWLKVREDGVPSCPMQAIGSVRRTLQKLAHPKAGRTSLISSIVIYASVGIPNSLGCTSIMTSTGFLQYLRKRSLISRSELRILGPVEYQPTMCSLAAWTRLQWVVDATGE